MPADYPHKLLSEGRWYVPLTEHQELERKHAQLESRLERLSTDMVVSMRMYREQHAAAWAEVDRLRDRMRKAARMVQIILDDE